MERRGIKHFQIPLPAHKEAGVVIPKEDMLKVVLILLDPKNYPVLVHCNKGKHRTGCTIACLRKVKGWAPSEVLEEYRFYSAPKSRSLDEAFFGAFDCTEITLVAQKAGLIPMLPSPPYSQPSSLRRVSTVERTPENQTAVSNATSASANSGTTGTAVLQSGPTPEEVAAVGKKLQTLSVE
jgi:tyrosine-protein phosphatase SIW14